MLYTDIVLISDDRQEEQKPVTTATVFLTSASALGAHSRSTGDLVEAPGRRLTGAGTVN